LSTPKTEALNKNLAKEFSSTQRKQKSRIQQQFIGFIQNPKKKKKKKKEEEEEEDNTL